jgi:hypothetical protein
VAAVCGGKTELGEHAAQLLCDEVADFPKLLTKDLSTVTARTEFAWTDPVSPHLAVHLEVGPQNCLPRIMFVL